MKVMKHILLFFGILFCITTINGCSNDVKSSNQLSEIESNLEFLQGQLNDINSSVEEIESNVKNIESNSEFSYHVTFDKDDYPSTVFYRINNRTGEIESRVRSGFGNSWETYRD